MKLNKKGFTLVELLAVIVILAVIMLVAVTAVGPAITNSKRGAFFSTLSSVEDAAALYATTQGLTSSKCVTITELINAGHLNNKDKNLQGKVQITVTTDATTKLTSYKYLLTVKNADFGVAGKQVSEFEKDSDFPKASTVTSGLTCS